MNFRILGPLEVIHQGKALELGGLRQRAVLAVLLLHANEVVSSDALIDRLWGERPPPTAAKALQVHVSRLRKRIGSNALLTRSSGYVLQVGAAELDLHRFERLVGEARTAGPEEASRLLQEALSLWRGSPLADFAYETFAQAEITRLEELRLAALEARIAADLSRGLNAHLVGELERLVARYPLRERLRSQLMLALYRSGRQSEALDQYQAARRLLSDELGLEPGEALKSLQKAILAHDPSLEPGPAAGPAAAQSVKQQRAILVVPRSLDALGALLALAEPLASSGQTRELVIAHVGQTPRLKEATSTLRERRDELLARGVAARAAAFASPTPGEDLVRLASEQDVDLILLDAGPDALTGDAAPVLASAPCDVALLLESGGPLGDGPIIVPFGAAGHDWAALELGAWLARATGAPLGLIGAAADDRPDGRDASRLLADASLIVQRTAGVVAEPLLASPGREGVLAQAEGAGLLVVGLSERWQHEGLGPVRSQIAASPPAPTAFVRRGLRPGGLAPSHARTRFTWSLTVAVGKR